MYIQMVSLLRLRRSLQRILSHRINLVAKFSRLSHLDGWITLGHRISPGGKGKIWVELLENLANTCQTLKYVRFGCSARNEQSWMMIERNDSDGAIYKGWRWATSDGILADERINFYVRGPGCKVKRDELCSWQYPFHKRYFRLARHLSPPILS